MNPRDTDKKESSNQEIFDNFLEAWVVTEECSGKFIVEVAD